MGDLGAVIERKGYRREIRVYMSINDLAEIVDVPPELLELTHVDTAPDRDEQVVRICLIEFEAE